MQQIITGSYPRFIATAVGALLSIVTDIGHKPPAVVTEHCGTVVFMIVIGGSNHQTVFIRRLYGLVDLLHLFLCNLSRSGKGEKDTYSRQYQLCLYLSQHRINLLNTTLDTHHSLPHREG